MAWNEKRSRERVQKNDFGDFEVSVQDLSRSMDLSNLGKKDVRRAQKKGGGTSASMCRISTGRWTTPGTTSRNSGSWLGQRAFCAGFRAN